MAYPYLVPVKGMREKLIENLFFHACYWSNVLEWTRKDDLDYSLAYHLQPLSINQRY